MNTTSNVLTITIGLPVLASTTDARGSWVLETSKVVSSIIEELE